MESIKQITTERGKSYGDFKENMQKASQIHKLVVNNWGDKAIDNTEMLNTAVMMLAVKLSRISVTPEHIDSWVDIAGYASLVAESLEKQSKD